MSARTSRTSSSSCSRPPTTMSSGRSAASSISTRSTRSAASPTTRRSPATCRARACSRRSSRSWKARSPVGPAAGRPQAPAAGVPAGRHDQHPVHLRRRLLRASSGSSPARGRATSIGFGATVSGARGPPHRRTLPRGRAGGSAEVRPDPRVRRPPAGARDARGSRRGGADQDPDRAEERAGQAVSAPLRHGECRADLPPRCADLDLQARRSSASKKKKKKKKNHYNTGARGLRSIMEASCSTPCSTAGLDGVQGDLRRSSRASRGRFHLCEEGSVASVSALSERVGWRSGSRTSRFRPLA